MRLTFHCATTMTADLATDVAAASAAGYKAIEVWAAKLDAYIQDHSIAELARLFADSKVEPAAINSIEFIGFRRDDYPGIQRRCRQLCDIAHEIGSGTLVVVPSPIPYGRGYPASDLFFDWNEVVDEYVAVLQDLAGISAPRGVTLAFEFIGFPWCTVRTPRGALEIVQKAGHDNVGMNFDCCHFYGGGGEMAEIDLLDPSKISTFHLNDMEDIPKEAMTDERRVLPGKGVIPLGEICRRMKQIGYDGDCSIELFRPEYHQWDPYELAVTARQCAVEVLSPYFELD